MIKRIGWLGLIAVLFLAPSMGLAQEAPTYEVQPEIFTGFLSHPRYENGGMFVDMGFLYWRGNRPLNSASQIVAYRGFTDTGGALTGTAGTFVGSKAPALNTDQLRGPGVFQPGWDICVGWKFQSGIVVELDWKHLEQAKYTASASIIPPDFNTGAQLQDTFLSSPVFNFAQEWGGTLQKVPQAPPGDIFGIWNGASVMQIQWVQRFDIYQLNTRIPIWQTENYRNYGLLGPRVAWIWDQFRWQTIDYDLTGNQNPATSALYTNTVSNRLYGIHAGFGNDWFLGDTPIGTFAFELDCQAGLYANLVSTSASYERNDRVVSVSRNGRTSSLASSAEVRAGVTWYPWEAVELRFGYDLMLFFNTIGSPQPIDFNMGTINPQYQSIFMRSFQGLTASVTFVF